MGDGTILKLKKLYHTASEFVTEKWIETEEEAKSSRLHRFAHFSLLVYKSFYRNRCPARATALAYTTLLALVPLLAVVGSITTGMLQGQGAAQTRDLISRLVDTVVPQLRLMPKNTADAPIIFSDSQILDPHHLATRLSQAGDPVSRFIWSRLPPATQDLVKAYLANDAKRKECAEALAQSLNALIQSGPIYQESAFAGIKPSEEARRLLASQPLAGEQLAHLNRLFLEAAYPAELEKSSAAADGRQQVVDRLNEFVANIQTKTLGASGIIGLIVVAILLLSTIEDTFNDIWGVSRGRNWFRRLVQYWTTISLGPIVLAAGIALLSSGYLKSSQAFLEHWSWLTKLLFTQALPFFLVTTSFALLYKLMPNTQVNWGAALIGGFVGGGLWLVLNIFNGFFLSRVLTMSNIYGPLSIIPIFLIGMYFSWLIVLFGAQVGYAYQNREVYVQEKKAESVSQRGREYVALRLMVFLAERFDLGRRPPTLLNLATELGVPSRLVSLVLAPLIESHLVLEVSAGGEAAYTPGRPLETITCHDILQTLRTGGGQELQTRDDPSRAPVCAEFENILKAERQAAAAVSLKELVRRIPPSSKPVKEKENWQVPIPEQRVT